MTDELLSLRAVLLSAAQSDHDMFRQAASTTQVPIEIVECTSVAAACRAVADGADALVLMTEWNQFRNLDLGRIRNALRQPIFVDGRNVYDPARMLSLGFIYEGMGRLPKKSAP